VRGDTRLVGDCHTDGLLTDVQAQGTHEQNYDLRTAKSGKKRPCKGDCRAWAPIETDYLLPQVVGETSGMRGREPPVIHRVETFTCFVARRNL
jgi:hypothetical protein